MRSVRKRMVLWYILTLGCVSLVLIGLFFVSYSRYFYKELDKLLKIKAFVFWQLVEDFRGTYNRDLTSAVNMAMKFRDFKTNVPEAKIFWLSRSQELNLFSDYIQVSDCKSSFIASSHLNLPQGLPLTPKETSILFLNKPIIKNIKILDVLYRVIYRPIFLQGRCEYIIIIATELRPAMFFLRRVFGSAMILMPFIIFVSILLGNLFVGRILKVVNEISRTAERLHVESLTMRVKTEASDKEIKHLVDTFNNMIARLEESFKHISQFSTAVSHELKTPLAIMRGESELALLKERSQDEYKRVIKDNLDEVNRMRKIVQDLLLLTRINYQTEILKFSELDLVSFFKDVYGQSKILADEKKINLHIEYLADDIIVRADDVHLRRLFFNLIQNAIKFTPKEKDIFIKLNKDNINATVSIIDTGKGISKQEQKKIFDMFYRTKVPGQEDEYSMGLGLSIVKAIVKAHKGTISLNSDLGKGSEFIVILPLAERATYRQA